MRRPLLASLALAAALLVSTASTALMATTERTICEAEQGAIWASYIFDDQGNPAVAPLVTILKGVNNTGVNQPITVVVIDPADDSIVLFRNIQARQGTRTFDIANRNIRMVDRLDREGNHYWGLPYSVGCQIG